MLLKSIFDTENVESRYLLEYEFLKYLTGALYDRNYGSQLLVKRFVQEKYNVQVNDEKRIEIINDPMSPNKLKDCLSVCRNIIGHPAVTKIDKQRNDNIGFREMISKCSRDINEVILFAIREKKRLNGSTYSNE